MPKVYCLNEIQEHQIHVPFYTRSFKNGNV